MNSTFIVNIVGKATPATIKQLAAETHENGGKWLISMVNFIEDSVAAVIKIELPADNASTVKQDFQTYPGLLVEITDADLHVHKSDAVYKVRLYANDRAGIVN